MKELRIKMIKDAKMEVIFNFVQISSFNRLCSLDLTKAMLLSLTPEEYAD